MPTECFFDLTLDGKEYGRVVMQLDPKMPETSENFRLLCTGEKKDVNGNHLQYKGCRFHEINQEKGIIIGGDIHNGNGTGGRSIYGLPFQDEKEGAWRFDQPGGVAMLSSGPDANKSQFFVFVDADANAFPTCRPFGRVKQGLELLAALREKQHLNGLPLVELQIADCGQL